jgi:hypothetical protein
MPALARALPSRPQQQRGPSRRGLLLARGNMRHEVLLGLAREREQRRAAGRPGAQIEGCARGAARAQAARASFEPRVRFACGDLAELDEEDRASLVQLAHRAVDGVVVECGPGQEPPGSAKAGDPCAFGVALVGDDDDAVGVRERALSLLVGIAGEAAGALATLDNSAAVRADWGVGCDRSGKATDRFVADVAWCAAREQTDVAFRHARGAQCLGRAARRELSGICLGERRHGDLQVFLLSGWIPYRAS